MNEDQIGDDTITNRLKVDYLKQTGKYKSFIADQYIEVDGKNISILRCKEHRSAITCVCITSDNKIMFSGSKDGSIVKCTYANDVVCNTITYNLSYF